MCVVCIEWEKGKMTSREALRALGELRLKPEHLEVVVEKILQKEAPMTERDDNIEKLVIDVVEDRKKDKYGSS